MSIEPNRGTSWMSPYITVKDVDAAAKFYKDAFTFSVQELAPGEDGTTWHGELRYKDQLIMIGKEAAWCNNDMKLSPKSSKTSSPITMYVYCENVDNFYQHAVAAGATALSPPEDTFWGDRMCSLGDIDGYNWCFATAVGEHKK